MDWSPPPKLWIPPRPAIIRAASFDDAKLAMPLVTTAGAASVRGMRAGRGAGGNDAFTKLLLHCDGANGSTTFTDASPSARGNATVYGNAQVSTAQSVFGGASLYVDGTGDYISYAYHADFDPGSGEFTLDFRFRPDNTSAGFRVLFAFGNAYAPFLLAQDGTSYLLYATTSNGSWNTANGVSMGTAAATTWTMLSLVRSGDNLKVCQDGSQVGSDTPVSGSLYNPSADFAIGSQAGANYAIGHFDEVRWSKGIARWTANHSVPTKAYS